MQIALLSSLLALLPLPQQEAAPPESKRRDIDSRLFQVQREVEAGADAAGALARRGLALRPDGRVKLTIVGPPGAAAVGEALVRPLGASVRATWGRRTSVWVPPAGMIELAEALPDGYRLKVPTRSFSDDLGPVETGSDAWRDAGADGSGVHVAVIDRGFNALSDAVAADTAPSAYFSTDYVGDGLENGSEHGAACVETVFDHAPGAFYSLYRMADLVDYGQAMDHAIASGVDVVSASQSFYNTGWMDGTGDACAAVKRATDAGLLVFTSAGNRASSHWQGFFLPSPGNLAVMEFAPGDDLLQVDVEDGAQMWIYLSWNTTGGGRDFDLELLTGNGVFVLDSSHNQGDTADDFEELYYNNTTGSDQTLAIQVENAGSFLAEVELFVHFQDGSVSLEHSLAEGSTTSPSNSLEPNCLSVGAVPRWDYSDPAATDPIASYSGQGPTNSGQQAPDLCAPTATGTVVYVVDDDPTASDYNPDGLFGGTSCATPNAAGVAAVLWSEYPLYNANGIRHLLLRQAGVLRDWGVPGEDFVYGAGGTALVDYHPGTTWVDRQAQNTGNLTALPFYSVSSGHAAVPPTGRLVIFPGTYPEAFVWDKSVPFEILGDGATVLGD